MGVSRTPADLVGKLGKAIVAMERVETAGVKRAALAVTTTVRASIATVAPSGRLRGVGKSGARVGARYELLGPDAAIVKATGPLHLVERDTTAHVIRPRRARALRFAGGDVRAAAHHPGTHGQHPFEHGAAAGAHLAEREFATGVRTALAAVFR